MSSVEKADMTEEQVRAEESAQGADVYVHKFKKPFTWEGETYEEKDCTYYFSFPLGQRMVSAVRAA